MGHLYKKLRDPWIIPFEKKMNAVFQAHLKGKKTVVYLYENPDNGTFRYRGYNMCRVLEGSAGWGAAYFFSHEIEMLKNYIELIDVAVIIRYRWDESLDGFIKECGKRKIKTVFDVDDLVFDLKHLHVLINTHGLDFSSSDMYEYWSSYFSRLGMTGSMCDACISTNDYIVERLKDYFKKPGFIVPNYLNAEQVETSHQLRMEKNKQGFKKPYIVGYFSGSPSHKNDFELVSAELAELIAENSGIYLKVAGYMDMPDNLKKYAKQKRITRVPFRDFRELQKEIAEVDVNIVPLLDNIFTNCKSELKFFESAIVDTVTCASPTYAYSRAIKHGKNGYICRQGEWYTVIKKLYEGGVPPAVLENARTESLLLYGPENQLKKIENILDTIAK